MGLKVGMRVVGRWGWGCRLGLGLGRLGLVGVGLVWFGWVWLGLVGLGWGWVGEGDMGVLKSPRFG